MGNKRSEINTMTGLPWGPKDWLMSETDFFCSLTN